MENATIKTKQCKVYSLAYKASHELSHTKIAIIVANSKEEAWDMFLCDYGIGYDESDLRCHREKLLDPQVLICN